MPHRPNALKALAAELDRYMQFRARREDVKYKLYPSFYHYCLRLGCRRFFGIECDERSMIRDTQQPQIFEEYHTLQRMEH
jgi:hypothetical protein